MLETDPFPDDKNNEFNAVAQNSNLSTAEKEPIKQEQNSKETKTELPNLEVPLAEEHHQSQKKKRLLVPPQNVEAIKTFCRIRPFNGINTLFTTIYENKQLLLVNKEEIEKMEKEHEEAPHLRILQKALAKDLTIRVHSEEDYNAAVNASEILFGKGTADSLASLSEKMFLAVFDGVPQMNISKDKIAAGVPVVDFLTEETNIFPSKGEARRMLKDNGVSINKMKVNDTFVMDAQNLINGKYILVQKGKKNYYIVIVM